jgi:hypothetical protein
VNSTSAARTGSIATNSTSTLFSLAASNAFPAASKVTNSSGTPSRLASSRDRSAETPRGSPSGPFCASTPLPKLIAARSLPVGASSFSASGGTCATAACAASATRQRV